jgi:serine protease DegS
MQKWTRLLTFIAQSVTVGLAAAFVVVMIRPDLLGLGETEPATSRSPASFAQAVARSAPSVANVHTVTRVRSDPGLLDDSLMRRYFGDRAAPTPQRNEANLGSGVIIDDSGHVLTNHHVVAGADEIRLAFTDGRILTAEVIGTDPDTDLALLAVDADDLPVIARGRSSDVRVGDMVLAIGNPFGLSQTVTQGIVSATGRDRLGHSVFEDFIQTDAAINPGNSGGALVDAEGRLIGINTAVFSRDGSSIGIGFAIPVDLAMGVMAELLENGRVIRGWLGIEPQDLTPALAESFGVSGQAGVAVAGVYRNGPSHLAGIRAGDVLTAIDGEPIPDRLTALAMITDRAPGEVLTVDGIRSGTVYQVQVTVGERPVRQR